MIEGIFSLRMWYGFAVEEVESTCDPFFLTVWVIVTEGACNQNLIVSLREAKSVSMSATSLLGIEGRACPQSAVLSIKTVNSLEIVHHTLLI